MKTVFSCTIVSALLLLLFSGSTSPLYNLEFTDGMVFQYVALGLMHGQIPYIDIFDHKGPFTYFINYLGLLMGGKVGILILQWFNLSATLILCTRFCVSRKIARWRPLVLFIVCTFIIQFLDEGDMTEEWSLLPIAIPTLFFLRSFTDSSCLLRFRHHFILGICVGLLALLRLNNAAPLLGLFIWWALLEIRKKEYLGLLKSIGIVILGTLIPISVACLWFYNKAGLQGLYELYYANILFNLEYAQKPWSSGIPLWKELIAVFFQLTVIGAALIKLCKRDYRIIGGLLFALAVSILTMGRAWFLIIK